MATANSTIARPYAKAIFEIAEQEKKIAKWSEMLDLLASIGADSQISIMIEEPSVTAKICAEVFFDIAGEKIDERARNLVLLLSQNNRLQILKDIRFLYEEHRALYEKTIDAEVISFMPLSDAQKESIEKALRVRLKRDINLSIVIDKEILGGAIIRAGDLVIDGSLTGKLKRLASELAA